MEIRVDIYLDGNITISFLLNAKKGCLQGLTLDFLGENLGPELA